MRTLGPIFVLLAAALLESCATSDSAGDPRFLGFKMRGVTVDRVTRLGANDEQAFLEASGSVADLDARIRRGDFAFRVYLDDFRTRTAFFPGLSDRQGRKLMGNNGVGVEVIVFPEMFPTEVYGQSRLAIEETRYDAMARFNRALFRRLEQMGFPASPRKR